MRTSRCRNQNSEGAVPNRVTARSCKHICNDASQNAIFTFGESMEILKDAFLQEGQKSEEYTVFAESAPQGSGQTWCLFLVALIQFFQFFLPFHFQSKPQRVRLVRWIDLVQIVLLQVFPITQHHDRIDPPVEDNKTRVDVKDRIQSLAKHTNVPEEHQREDISLHPRIFELRVYSCRLHGQISCSKNPY